MSALLRMLHGGALRAGQLRAGAARASSAAAGAQTTLSSHLGVCGRLAVAAGASLVALADPSRGDCVALATELTAGGALAAVRARVRAAPGGAALLAERPPRLCGAASAPALAALPAHTLGGALARFLAAHALDGGDRAPVRGVADAELAWLLQRARDAHDVWHVLAALPPTVAGELALKAFEAAHLRLPAALAAAAAAPLRLPARERAAYLAAALPWAARAGARARPLLAVRYEELWATPIDEVRALLRFEPAPVAAAA
jgi:ubiquinone biosynthesis protein COQ4